MAGMAAQVSLYPLGAGDLGTSIADALQTFAQSDLTVLPGAMSSILAGESGQVFAALEAAYVKAAAQGPVIMVVTLSNACPVDIDDTSTSAS